jgi:hypothetical protein
LAILDGYESALASADLAEAAAPSPGRLQAFLASQLSADCGEPVLSVAELSDDHVLDVAVKRSVRVKDELARDTSGRYFLASLGSFGPVVYGGDVLTSQKTWMSGRLSRRGEA